MTRAPEASGDHAAEAYPADTLGLSSEEMRRLGHKVVDMVVDRLERRAQEPVLKAGDPQMLTALLGGPAPREPMDPDASLELLAEVALANMQHGDHPRYFARVPGPSCFAAVLGDWLGSGFNAICSSWMGATGPATVELVALDWLRQMIGLPAGTEGILVSGGSIANLTAFAVARDQRGPGIAYLSDQAHASLKRDLRIMGQPEADIRVLESDKAFRMPVSDLKNRIEKDKLNGDNPWLVVATAGTTNTGAVDPLPELAELCRVQKLWLHVDGAYGAPAAIAPQGRRVLRGLEQADSLALDPHKWLFQPYDMGICFVSRPGALERCFSMTPEYLKDVRGGEGEVNFGERGLELSRRARALKLWMTLRVYGAEGLEKAVRKGLESAEFAEAYLRARPERWEVLSPAQLGVVCFALKGAGREEHEARVRALSDSGFGCATSTVLKGRPAFRMCLINPLTREADIARTIDFLAAGGGFSISGT